MVDKLERKWWIFYEFWILNLDPRFFKQQKKINILLNQTFLLSIRTKTLESFKSVVQQMDQSIRASVSKLDCLFSLSFSSSVYTIKVMRAGQYLITDILIRIRNKIDHD